MIKRRRPKQWLIDGPAGVGLMTIALLSIVVAINNMVLSATLKCDRNLDQTISCQITTRLLNGQEQLTLHPVTSAKADSIPNTYKEGKGYSYLHHVALHTPTKSALLPLPRPNAQSQAELTTEINRFINSSQTQFNLTLHPSTKTYLGNAFIGLILMSMGIWGGIFLSRGMD